MSFILFAKIASVSSKIVCRLVLPMSNSKTFAKVTTYFACFGFKIPENVRVLKDLELKLNLHGKSHAAKNYKLVALSFHS